MHQETSFLAPGALPFVGADIQVARPLRRIGDGLTYAALDGGRPARLREYCPRGIAQRSPDGTLHPADERFADAWASGLARFLEKGQRLTAIDHPGVARIWRAAAVESGGVRQAAYWVGAPVGEPLASTLDSGRYIPPADVVRIGMELADVLSYLHARGITHLDISPDTVSITAGRVQLSDFSIDDRPYMALLETQDGLVRPGYSPIEAHDASGADPLGPPADVYAASALLFRLVTGRHPTPWQERWRDPAASQLPDGDSYPPAFLDAIRQGMGIEPQERFPDGRAWRAAMGRNEVRPAAAPMAAPEPLPEPASSNVTIAEHRRRSSPVLPIVLGLVALAALIAIYFALRQPRTEPTRTDRSATTNRTALPSALPGEPTTEAEEAAPVDPGASGNLFGDIQDRRLPPPSEEILQDAERPPAPEDETEPEPEPEAEPDEEEVRTVDLSLAGALSGQWHARGDPDCRNPAVNQVGGDRLTSRSGGATYRHRILSAQGGTIQTIVTDGRLAGRRFQFNMGPGGSSYSIGGETWTRC
jgi:serine/threonine protein kinase